tara:strand:- start:5421 stop:5978 length:558 start_codon:yes stop_codon:yes gene_type:complete
MNYLVTGLICSGKSTFLQIAQKHNFEIIKSDDIVSDLYNDKTIIYKIKEYLNIHNNQNKLKERVREFFFESKKNREIIEAIFHPTVHEIILNKFRSGNNMMIELPPITSNYNLFKKYSSVYIFASDQVRITRFNKRKINDENYFNKINAMQDHHELIKESCNIVIDNNSDIDSLNKYFGTSIIES